MNRKGAFLEPEINQYGSHMVMSNVTRHSKFKFINIDTKYRDNLDSIATTPPYYNITLPEKVNDVKSVMVCNAEIPMTFYNVSSSLGNNYFKIVTGTTIAGTSPILIKIPNGEYTTATLKTAINSAISLTSYNGKLTVDILDPPKFATITANNGGPYTLVFDVDINGNADAYNFKNKLGWLLGFRQARYTVTSTSPNKITSENMVDLNTVRYLYLALEEFTKGTQNTFLSPMSKSFLRSKTILAKISLNKKSFSFGDILPANNFNGYLLSDRRQYSGKVDLQKLNVQLIDENGNPVELNGMDFSFCIEVEHE